MTWGELKAQLERMGVNDFTEVGIETHHVTAGVSHVINHRVIGMAGNGVRVVLRGD